MPFTRDASPSSISVSTSAAQAEAIAPNIAAAANHFLIKCWISDENRPAASRPWDQPQRLRLNLVRQPTHVAVDAFLHGQERCVVAGRAQLRLVGLSEALILAAQRVGERHVFDQPYSTCSASVSGGRLSSAPACRRPSTRCR